MSPVEQYKTPPVTDPEIAANLEAVRAAVGDDAKHLDDQFVGKFLIARKNNVTAASDMLKAHLEWRKANNVEEVLGEYFGKTSSREGVDKFIPMGFYGTDKNNNVIYVERPGKCNVSDTFGKVGEETMMRWHIALQETGRMLYRKAGGEGLILIMDVAGLGMSHFSSKAIGFFRQTSAMDEANYPEHMVKCIVINAGKTFKYGYKLVAPMIDPVTRSKVMVFDNDYPETLKEVFGGIDKVPKFLGGNRPDTDCISTLGAPNPKK